MPGIAFGTPRAHHAAGYFEKSPHSMFRDAAQLEARTVRCEALWLADKHLALNDRVYMVRHDRRRLMLVLDAAKAKT